MANNNVAIKAGAGEGQSKLLYFIRNNQIGMALVISALLFIINCLVNPASFNKASVGTIMSLTLMLSLAAAGQTIVIISGGIDLCVGANMSIAAVMTASIMSGDGSMQKVLGSLFVGIGLCAVFGLVNGLGAIKLGLPPMIITMSVANVVTRLQMVFTEGTIRGLVAKSFSETVTYRMFGIIPTMIFYALVVFAFVFYLLNRTRFGQQLFLCGNNPDAAYLNGIHTNGIRVSAYVISGVLSAIAGWIGAGSLYQVTHQAFDTYTMMSLASVVIGGTLLAGGKGSFTGTIAGALLLQVLSNFLIVLDISESVRNVVMGLVLIAILTAYNRGKPIRQ